MIITESYQASALWEFRGKDQYKVEANLSISGAILRVFWVKMGPKDSWKHVYRLVSLGQDLWNS